MGFLKKELKKKINKEVKKSGLNKDKINHKSSIPTSKLLKNGFKPW